MKQIKLWQYAVILCIAIIIITAIKAFVCGEVSEEMFGLYVAGKAISCIADLIIMLGIGYLVERIVQKFTQNTLVPNVIITLAVYLSLRYIFLNDVL